jgi:hypothetical protein
MSDAQHDRLAVKLRATFDLQRFGIAMMRQNLVRRFPAESDSDIDARMRDILQRRLGAEFGDADGQPGSWPRSQA